jgi:hypothetical protein
MVGNVENDVRKGSLPPLPGTYVLVQRFSKRLEILVGKLSVLLAQAGFRAMDLRAWPLVLVTLPLEGATPLYEVAGVTTISVTLRHKQQGLVDGRENRV